MKNFEVEKKYKVHELSKIESLIDRFDVVDDEHEEIDIVYLYGVDDFSSFNPGDAVMRIRKKKHKIVLTMKKQVNDESNIEHECEVNNIESMDSILKGIGFKQVARVEKFRKVLKINSAEVCLDKVKGLGEFVEIEILCSENEQENALNEINKIAELLGLNESMIEKRKYDLMIKEMKVEYK